MKLYFHANQQDPAELLAFVKILRADGVRNYLEIGSKFGASLWQVGIALERGARIISVDLPGGTKLWNQSRASLTECIKALCDRGHDARVLWGDSTSPSIIAQVSALSPFDAVFIDANHTLPYLEKDFAHYGPLARIVAFHDIAWHRAPEWVGTRIDVPQFWSRIKQAYRHEEFKFCPTRENNGIGVLWR